MDQPSNNTERKQAEEVEPELAIQQARLKLDQQRFQFDVTEREATRTQDAERFVFEKSKDRITRWQMALQLVLPLLFSIAAIGINSCNENRRSEQAENLQKRQFDLQQKQYDLQYNQAVSSYNDGRIELFRKMTQGATSDDEIMKVYKEVFPRDSIILQNEQKDVSAIIRK